MLTEYPNVVVPWNEMVAPDLTLVKSSTTPAGTLRLLMVTVAQLETSCPLTYVPVSVHGSAADALIASRAAEMIERTFIAMFGELGAEETMT